MHHGRITDLEMAEPDGGVGTSILSTLIHARVLVSSGASAAPGAARVPRACAALDRSVVRPRGPPASRQSWFTPSGPCALIQAIALAVDFVTVWGLALL